LILDPATYPNAPLVVPNNNLSSLYSYLPTGGADPEGQALLSLYPNPTNNNAPCGSPNYTALVNRTINFDDFFGRVDHRWTPKDNIFFRYSLNGDHQILPPETSPRAAPTNLPGYGTVTHDQNQMAGIDWSHEFSATLINE
jgi:hypothetical protein